jgi:hypothetical protein
MDEQINTTKEELQKLEDELINIIIKRISDFKKNHPIDPDSENSLISQLKLENTQLKDKLRIAEKELHIKSTFIESHMRLSSKTGQLLLRLMKDGPATYTAAQVAAAMKWDLYETGSVFNSLSRSLLTHKIGYRAVVTDNYGNKTLLFSKN